MLEFHTKPENAALEEELDQNDRKSKPLEAAMKDAQARGERIGTPLQLEEKPADPGVGEAQAHVSGFAVTPWPGQS